MNWDAIGAAGELLGSVAVLATLGYLAVQTRQTARVATAQGPQWINDGIKQWFASMRADPEFTRLLRIALHDWNTLELNDRVRVHSFFAEMVVHLNGVHALLDQGLISAELARAWENNALGVLLTPGGRVWWEETSFFYEPRTKLALNVRLQDAQALPPPWTAAPFWDLQAQDHAWIQAHHEGAGLTGRWR